MLENIFPFKLYLHIFQLFEYNQKKLFTWVLSHYWIRKTENKKPLVWTQKAKTLYYGALLLIAIVIIFLTFNFKFVGFIIGVLFATQAYLILIVTSYILFPVEWYQKKKIRKAAVTKLNGLPNLKIIGITGSYGKTSVKEFLYHMVKTDHMVLRTPESYNTPYGIAKVINLELNKNYEYFICEMGAYRRGEIKEICDMVHPHYGILTGINEQHLESFGSLENTTLGKFELIDSLPSNGFGVVNEDNSYIKNQSKKYTIKLIPYGFHNDKFSIKSIHTTTKGSEFTLVLDGKEYHAKTKLIGTPNIQNILGAATMSFNLGIPPTSIVAAIATLKPVPHRLEIKTLPHMILIDNAFNSNVDGFKESINLLTTFTNTTIFATPGIVELGDKTYTIHKELGAILDAVDYVILIGNSQRTKGILDGLKDKKKALMVENINELWEKIDDLHINQPVVLLENDLPDNY